jgi:hypothetical protein
VANGGGLVGEAAARAGVAGAAYELVEGRVEDRLGCADRHVGPLVLDQKLSARPRAVPRARMAFGMVNRPLVET